jgi:hypothetical protein
MISITRQRFAQSDELWLGGDLMDLINILMSGVTQNYLLTRWLFEIGHGMYYIYT